jgi:hypothetical protein
LEEISDLWIQIRHAWSQDRLPIRLGGVPDAVIEQRFRALASLSAVPFGIALIMRRLFSPCINADMTICADGLAPARLTTLV